MRYIKLGSTGLDVSPVAIGAMTYGDPGRGHPAWSLDEETSRPLIKHALEADINFFDTANMGSDHAIIDAVGAIATGRGQLINSVDYFGACAVACRCSTELTIWEMECPS